MKAFAPLVSVIVLGFSATAYASDDCQSPMAEWKPRETVAAYAKDLGVSTDRMRIDDGCYEVRGRDGDGNRVELKIEPATLEIMELEVRFAPGANATRYLPNAKSRQQGATNRQPTATPISPSPSATGPRAEIN